MRLKINIWDRINKAKIDFLKIIIIKIINHGENDQEIKREDAINKYQEWKKWISLQMLLIFKT